MLNESAFTQRPIVDARNVPKGFISCVIENRFGSRQEADQAGHTANKRGTLMDTVFKHIYTNRIEPDSIQRTQVGLRFSNGNNDPTASRLSSDSASEHFILSSGNNLDFITSRFVFKVPIDQINLSMPLWQVGVNEIRNAITLKEKPGKSQPLKDRNLEIAVANVAGEMSWEVAYAGLLSCGFKIPDALEILFEQAKATGFNLPKKSDITKPFLPLNLLPEMQKGLMTTNDDIEAMARILSNLCKIKDENFELATNILSQPVNIEIAEGDCVIVLPSHHEITFREMIKQGYTITDIYKQLHRQTYTDGRSLPNELTLLNEVFGRIITAYIDPKKINFYPQNRWRDASEPYAGPWYVGNDSLKTEAQLDVRDQTPLPPAVIES